MKINKKFNKIKLMIIFIWIFFAKQKMQHFRGYL